MTIRRSITCRGVSSKNGKGGMTSSVAEVAKQRAMAVKVDLEMAGSVKSVEPSSVMSPVQCNRLCLGPCSGLGTKPGLSLDRWV